MDTKNNQLIDDPHDVLVVIHEPTGYFTIYETRGTDKYEDDILRAAGVLKGENADELEKNIEKFKKAISEGGQVDQLWEEFGLIEGNVPGMQIPTDHLGESVQSDNRERSETISPNNNRTENLEKNRTGLQKVPSNQNRASQENPEREAKSDAIDLETVAQTVALSAAMLAGIGLVGLLAAGVASAPVLAGVGILWSAGMAANTFLKRANEAMDAGEDDYLLGATAAGVSDLVPIVDVVEIGEILTGHNYMTGQAMTQQERSVRTGNLVVGSLSSLRKGLGAPPNQSRKSDVRLTREEGNVVNHLKDNLMAKMGIALDYARHEPGMISNKASAASNALHFYAKKSLEQKFGNRVEVKDKPKDLRLVTMRGQIADLKVKVKSTGKEIVIELKATAWIDKNGRLQTPFKNQKQTAALQISAKKNPDKPHIVVTPAGKFVYNVKTRKWEKLLDY